MMNKKLQFKVDFSSGSIDREKGEIQKVSIITEGEAKGHGVKIDAKTLSGLYELINGKTVKSYLRHSWGDRITDEIGLFSAFYIDGEKLRGTFKALKAFREHNRKEFDTLMELSEEAPENFGVSISFSAKLVYFDGEEEKDYSGEEDVEEIFVRVLDLYSIDWVGEPAANPTGIFSANDGDEPQEEPEQPQEEPERPQEKPEAPQEGEESEPAPEENPKVKELEARIEEINGRLEEAEQKNASLLEELERFRKGNEIVTEEPKDDLLSQYHAIGDRRERLAFYRKNKAELLKRL